MIKLRKQNKWYEMFKTAAIVLVFALAPKFSSLQTCLRYKKNEKSQIQEKGKNKEYAKRRNNAAV